MQWALRPVPDNTNIIVSGRSRISRCGGATAKGLRSNNWLCAGFCYCWQKYFAERIFSDSNLHRSPAPQAFIKDPASWKICLLPPLTEVNIVIKQSGFQGQGFQQSVIWVTGRLLRRDFFGIINMKTLRMCRFIQIYRWIADVYGHLQSDFPCMIW